MNYSSSCGSGQINLYQVGVAVDINPACTSYCNGGNAFGIEQYTYEGTINISKCSDWTFSVCEAARNNAISTIQAPGGQNLCVQATLDNSLNCNNSPTFSQYPTPFLCAGNFCYNNGAQEIDGDSLVYTLVTPLNTGNGGTVTYTSNYSATNPVGGGSTFDPNTGNICVTPPGAISGILAIRVDEYRNGIIIGSIIRDIQINVFPCNLYAPPQLTGIDTSGLVNVNVFDTYVYELNCPTGTENINFDINTINNNSFSQLAFINMTSNINIPGASFTVANNNSMNPVGTFDWNPTLADTAGSPYFFTVNTVNNACPAPGNFSFQYQINLNASALSLSYSVVNPSCGIANGSINITPIGGNPAYSYIWSNGQTGASITGLSSGTYTVDVNDINGCSGSESITITSPPLLSSTITATNVSCFGGNDGIAAALPSGGTAPYTYLWSDGQTTQTATGLTAAAYSCVITDALGCVFTTSSVTVTQPQIISTPITSSNLSCFGSSDGTVSVIPTGGTPPYTYLWSSGQTSSSLTSLLAGTYSVIVSDADGCTGNQSVTISEPLALTARGTSSTCKLLLLQM